MSQGSDTLQIQHNVSLKSEHTFHLSVKTKYFIEINSREELIDLLTHPIFQNNRRIIIGHGSNILFANDFDGLVVKMNIRGKGVVAQDNETVTLEIAAGEEWHDLVMYAVDNNWGGIENLALIPGTVGAAPIQNIGAYGQTFEDVFVSLKAVDVITGALITFDKTRCAFGYRTSIFKHSAQGKFVVVSVTIQLHKNPTLELSYKSRYESLETELKTFADEPYTVKDVARAIINIRSRKLPDPNKVGNAGSFFKNPLVRKTQVIELQKRSPNLPFYPAKEWSGSSKTIEEMPDDTLLKVPAAWLLEDMGWKGKRVGDCGNWPSQPLSIVNYGGATPVELLAFIESVRAAVLDRYGVTLENEVEIIG